MKQELFLACLKSTFHKKLLSLLEVAYYFGQWV